MPDTIPFVPFDATDAEPAQVPTGGAVTNMSASVSDHFKTLAPKTAEALKIVDTGTNSTVTGPSPNPPVQPKVLFSIPKPDLSEAAFAARNTIDNVPFESQERIPSPQYFWANMDRLKENQIKYYQSKGYPVRLSDTGEIIVRVADSKTGKPKDIMANPHGMDLNDFMDLLTSAPEIAGGIVAARKGDVKGIASQLANIGRMALGAEASGAAKDIGIRAIEGEPINPREILGTRIEMAGKDVAMGAAIGAGVKAATKLISPFSEKGPLQFDLAKAKDYFKAKGFNLPTTIGEETGAPILLRIESFIRQQPGSSVPMDKIINQSANEIQKIQNVMMGLPAEATEAQFAARKSAEQVGEEAMGAVGAKNLQMEREVQRAKSRMQGAATLDIESAFQRQAGAPSSSLSDLGQNLRTKIKTDFDKFKAEAEANYAKVEANPLVKEKNIPAAPLAKDADKLYQSLPKVEKTISTETGLMDQFENPIMRNEKGEEVLWEFVPSGLKSKLERLRSIGDQQFRLDELLAMRREIRNSISEAESIPGVQTKYLSQMENMVDTRIKDGLKDLDPQLLKDWQTANDAYAKGIQKFKQHGIANALKEPEQPGFVGNRDLAQRAVQDPDWLAAYKQYFGAGSPEFRQVKRAILDDMATLDPITGTINGADFFRNLTKMANEKPEVLREVMGPSWGNLIKIAKLQEYSQSTKPLRIDAEEMSKVLGTGTFTEKTFADLLAAESKRAVAYQNKLRSMVSAGTLDADKINPSEFVRFMTTNARPSEIRDVLALISDRPELVEDIRRTAVEQVLNDASVSPRAIESIVSRGRVAKQLKASELDKALQTQDQVATARWRSVLGDETYQDLVQLRNFLRPRELKQQAFTTAGSLSVGSKIHQLEELKVLTFAEKAMKNFVEAFIYTSKPARMWAANNAITSENAAMWVNYLTLSTPFVNALIDKFGVQRAEIEARNLKAAIDQFVKTQGAQGGNQTPKSPMGPIPLEKF